MGVIIVHYGDSSPTQACVRSVQADPSEVARHIILVDNSPGLQVPIEGAVVVAARDNPGYGEGINRGFAALPEGRWDALVALNHDVRIQPGFLGAAVQALAEERVGAAAGPLFLDAKLSRLWYAGGGVSFATGTVWQSRSVRSAGRARRVGFLPGAAMAVSPDAFRELGGFDPWFFLYNEDLDLCLRLRRGGWTLRFVPEMVAVHELGAATGSRDRSALYLEYMARNRLRPFRPLLVRLFLAVLHTLYVAGRAVTLRARSSNDGARLAGRLLRGHMKALKTVTTGPR